MRAPVSSIVSFVVFTVSATATLACSPAYEERTPAQIRRDSAPVVQDQACRVLNGGVYDTLILGPARALGDGRFAQAVGETGTLVLVADCNTREATILRGPVTETGETSCGPYEEYGPIIGQVAPVDLSEGASLTDLVNIAATRGVSDLNPLQYFFQFQLPWETEWHDVGRRDRFNLLCGCQFYPESPGAS